MRRRYPLETLRSLRREQVDQHKAKLGTAHARVVQAVRSRERAEAARIEEEARAERVRGVEQERLARGAVRAWDLVQTGNWEQAARERRRALREAEGGARSAEGAERQAEQRARVELGKSQAASEAVEQHCDRWGAAEARTHELEVEEQALDRWTTQDVVNRARRTKRQS